MFTNLRNHNAIFSIPITFLCLLMFVSVSPIEAMRVDRFREGLFIEEEDKEQDLEGILWKGIQEQPYNPRKWEFLAVFYDYVGDYQGALEAFKNQVAYLTGDEDNIDSIYGNLARAYLLNDMGKDAGEWLRKADEINFYNPFNRWNSFRYHTEYEFDAVKAARDLSVLDEISDPGEDCFYDGFTSLENSGRLEVDQLVEVFEEAFRQNPDNHKAIRALAVALRFQSILTQSSFERVYVLLERAISLAPDFFPTYLTMANALFMEHADADLNMARAEAMVWLEKARGIDPDDPRLEYTEGNYHLSSKDYLLAIELFRRAIEKGFPEEQLREELSLAYNNYACEVYRSGEDFEKGLNLVNEALRLAPKHGVILSTRAELLYALGHYDEAWQDIQESIRQYPGHEEIKKNYDMIKAALEKRAFEKAQ